MAIKWTAERNERLLLLVVKDIKVDTKKHAEEWAKLYGNDDFKPTPRAIAEQFGVLKKKAGGKGKVTNGSTPKTPRTTTNTTPKKATTSKPLTPSRRKNAALSDDDEEASDKDDDSEPDLKNLPKSISRASLARSMKKPKKYQESDSEDEQANYEFDGPVKAETNGVGGDELMNDGDEIHVAAPKPKVNGGSLDSVMGELMAKNVSRKAFKPIVDDADESEVSDFAATL